MMKEGMWRRGFGEGDLEKGIWRRECGGGDVEKMRC